MFILAAISCSLTSPAIAVIEPSAIGIDLTPVQYKTAKNFSRKFCDAILVGLTDETAANIASRELIKVLLEPSLWSSTILTNGGDIKALPEGQMVSLTASNIINECGKSLSNQAQEDVKSMESFLNSKIGD